MLDGPNCLQDCRSSKSYCKKMVAMTVSTPELQRNVGGISPLFSLVLLMSVALRLSVEKNVCSLEHHFGSSNPSKPSLLQVLPISSPVRDPKKILTLSNTIHHRHATVTSDLNDQDFVQGSPPMLANKRHTPPPACGLSPRKQHIAGSPCLWPRAAARTQLSIHSAHLQAETCQHKRCQSSRHILVIVTPCGLFVLNSDFARPCLNQLVQNPGPHVTILLASFTTRPMPLNSIAVRVPTISSTNESQSAY